MTGEAAGKACDFLQVRDADCEYRTLPSFAFDCQPAAVAGKDMLGQREPKTGAALRTASLRVDSIETFRQPRQVLGRNAGTEIANRDECLAIFRTQGNFNALSRGAVFERVFDQVFEHADQLIAIATHL